MAIDVIGPMRTDGAALRPRERLVLAALVVRLGESLRVDEIAEAIWPDGERPSTWVKQVQADIGRVRRAIGASRIRTSGSGYALDVDPDEVDAVRFERLVDAARTHRESGDPERAIEGYRRALALWRGAPFQDVADWPDGTVAAARLERIRQEAEEGLGRARLDAGETSSVVPDLERLVAGAPLREAPRALLATALYRSGRQADALALLRATRRTLLDELGIEPGRELAELEQAVLRQEHALDGSQDAQTVRGDCPYRGLHAYDADDADDFRGREPEIATIVDRLDADAVVTVTGPSGSGKSSIVRAGVVPALRRRGRTVAVLEPGPGFERELRSAVEARRPQVVVVDQLEELAAGPTTPVPEPIGELLARQAFRGGVIVTVRSDYLDVVAADARLGPALTRSVLVVTPLGPDALRRAIEEPALRSGLRLEQGLVELVLRDADGAPGVLPHLSYALAETWRRREGRTLTVDGYLDAGGIPGAIAQAAERAYDALDGPERRVCHAMMLRLLAPSSDGTPIRRRIDLHALREDAEWSGAVDALADSRLVSVEGDTVVVAHESLARAWPRLAAWLADGRDDLRVMAAVSAGADEWDAAGRSDDDLLHGARLEAASEWRERTGPDLTARERAFLDRSGTRARDERAALRADSLRRARQNRRLRLAVAAIGVLLVGAIGAAGLAAGNARRAETNAGLAEDALEDARVEAIANTARALRDSDRDLAALLAAVAFRRWPDDPRTRSALLATLSAPEGLVQSASLPEAGTLLGAAVVPGTDRLVVAGVGRDVEVRDLETGAHLESSPAFTYALPDVIARPVVRVSADGRIAAIATLSDVTADGVAIDPGWSQPGISAALDVVDLETGSLLTEHLNTESWITDLAVGPDGTRVAWVDRATGDVVVRDTAGDEVRRVPGLVAAGASDPEHRGTLGFADATTLVVAGAGGAVTWIDEPTGAVLHRTTLAAASGELRVLPIGNGRALVTGARGVAALAPDGTVDWQQPATRAACDPIAAAPARARYFCGSPGGAITEFDLADGTPTGRSVDAQVGAVRDLWWSDAAGEVRFLTLGESRVGRWHVDGAGGAADLVARGQELVAGFAPGGEHLIVGRGTADGAIHDLAVWDPIADAKVLSLPTDVVEAVWAGDGLLRMRAADGAWRLMDVADREERPVFGTASTLFAPVHDDVQYQLDPTTRTVWARDLATWERTGHGITVEGMPSRVTDTADGRTVLVSSTLTSVPGSETESAVRTFDVISLVDRASGEVLDRRIGFGPAAVISGPDEVIAAGPGSLTRLDFDLEAVGTLPAPRGRPDEMTLTDDGAMLLVTTEGRSGTLYDLADGTVVGDHLRAADGGGAPFALHHSGAWLFMAADDGIARWSLAADDWYAAVCSIPGRILQPAEWETHLGYLGEYVDPCTGWTLPFEKEQH
ncbi:nSTAND1 domain-containing NTPase [Agromyces sp. SYSU T00194]|uniref:nSTAND1 domain-containing NTPase n=1 Tax=Agromyces chitinivorans TaxID=3158560 RepID=UPI00339842CA